MTASTEHCGYSIVTETVNVTGIQVENIELENIVIIYPNPSNGQITVKLDKHFQSGLIVEITNLTGQKVYSKIFKVSAAVPLFFFGVFFLIVNKSESQFIFIPDFTKSDDKTYAPHGACSSCQDQHSQDYAPFLRGSNTNDELCKDCHSARDVGLYADDNVNNKGSHPMYLYPSSDDRFNASPTSPIILVGSGVDSVG